MLKKNLKFILSLFIVFTLIGSTFFSYATDVNVSTNEEETTNVNAKQTDPSSVSEDENSTNSENTTSDENTTTDSDATSDDSSSDSATSTTTHDGDLYKSGGDIEITEAINGNAFISGNSVTVKGQIGGDLFVFANNLNIDGAQIYGNVFAVASNITLNGLIYDLYGVCNTLNVPYNGTVYRDIKVMCNTATIDGVIGGNVYITATQKLTLDADCMIYKDLNYSTPSEIEVKDGTVQGNVNYSSSMVKANVMDYVMSFAYLIIFVLVVWLLMMFIAPKFMEKATRVGKEKILPSLGFGILGIILIPVVSILLMFTIVGMPISLALMAVYALLVAISFTVVTLTFANMLGNKIKFFSKFKNLIGIILISLILWTLTLIPYVGIFIKLIITIYGFGILMISIFNKKLNKEVTE